MVNPSLIASASGSTIMIGLPVFSISGMATCPFPAPRSTQNPLAGSQNLSMSAITCS
jgi:hypothetical protein